MHHAAIPKHYLEQELRGSLVADNSLKAFIIQEMHDGLWFWDLKQTDNLWISPEFWESLHFDPAQRPHSREALLNLLIEEDLSKAASLSFDMLDEQDFSYDQVLRFENNEGGITHFRCRGHLIRDNRGRPHRLLGVLRDLTSTASIESFKDAANFRATTRGAYRMHSDLQHFIYSMSHDMVSPLRTASAALAEVKYALDTGNLQDATELTEMCEASVQRMLVLLGDMRNYFLHAQPSESCHELISSKETAHAVVEDLRAVIDEYDAAVEIDCQHDIIGHPSQIRVVLQNFAQNAIKFGSLNGPVSVKISTTPLPGTAKIRLSVSDDGPGIPSHQLNGIFQPFARLHLRRDVPGSGLGLSICSKIAENHNADIGVETLPDGGCRFFLDIAGSHSS
jgi:signal transduction histidine kinase